MKHEKGLFIVIEGIDGSGKGTQTDMAFERFKKTGRTVERWRFPRRDHPSGQLAKDYLKGKFGSKEEVDPYIASTFYAMDRRAARDELVRLLTSGADVVCERYVDSNAAYQGANIPDPAERTSFLAWLRDYEFVRLGLPRPDITILLDVPPSVGDKNVVKRTGGSREILEGDLSYQARVAQVYRELAEANDYATVDCMDGNGTQFAPEVCHDLVWEQVEPLL